MFNGRAVKPGEPLWLREDRLEALAWQEEQAERCPGCHRQWSETADPDAFEDYDAHLVVCHACAERARRRRDLHREGGNVDGVYVAVTRRADLE